LKKSWWRTTDRRGRNAHSKPQDLPRFAETIGEIEEEKEFEDTYSGQLAA